MRRFILCTMAMLAICATVVAQPNVKIEQSVTENFSKSLTFNFDEKDAMKEFIVSSLKKLKEADYKHRKIQLSLSSEKAVTVKIIATNVLTESWGECTQTYWNATVPQSLREALDQAGAQAVGAACSSGTGCVCYNTYYQNYFTGEGQWWGHSYCYTITIEPVCGCLNPAC